MNHSVHKPSRWIVDSNYPYDFRANNSPQLSICASTFPQQGTRGNVRRSMEFTQTCLQKPMPARSTPRSESNTWPTVIHVKLSVVTVKGSHRALLWVFSISGKYNKIFPRYPDHRCPAAACTNTSKATRNCNGDARKESTLLNTFGLCPLW